MNPILRPLVASSPAAILVFCIAPILHADTLAPWLQLRQQNTQWTLDYHPSPAQGAAMLHFSSDLSDLYSTNALILDVPAGSALLPLDVTRFISGSKGFFSITEYPGLTAVDFAPDDDDPQITEIPPLYDVETITALPDPVATGTALMVHFRLLDGTTGASVSLNGGVELELVTAGGDPVGFAYTLTPATLPLTAGVVNGSAILTTAGSLVGVYLAVKDVTSVPAPQVPRDGAKLGRKVVAIPPKTLAQYLNTSGGWHHPLGAVAPLAGCFGEWRCSKIQQGPDKGKCAVGDWAGTPHFGMDLAATAGSAVYPVKRGVVSHHGSLGTLGRYMVVVHGDGSASRYLHVDPISQIHQVVETSTLMAKVANIGDNHLHLELRSGAVPSATAGAYTTFGARPGVVYDPGIENTGFDIPLIQPGGNDVNAPEIKALYLWKADPKTAAFGAARPGPLLLQPGGVLVAQIVDPESGNLVPSHFDFAAEDPVTQVLPVPDSDHSFDCNTEADVRRLFQDHATPFANFGYVRRVGNVLPRPAMYHYWFKWDTSVYANQRLGPRKFRIGASDRAGRSLSETNGTFTFGPQLFPPATFAPARAPDGSTFDLEVRNLMGPFPSGMTGTPQDTIKLTLITSGLTSWVATFGGSGPPILTHEIVLTGHDAASEDALPVRVRLLNPNGPAPTGPQTLTIRATSGVFPDIAHDVTVPITVPITADEDGFALIPAGAFTMGHSSGDHDYLAPPPVTVTVSAFYMGKYEVTKALWDEVRTWGAANGYTDLAAGSGKASNHPVHSISWFDMLKWCNARSEKDGLTPVYTAVDDYFGLSWLYKTGIENFVVNWSANGYRLPTEAEWEKAARGGVSGKRFPWGTDTISQSQANYTRLYDPFSQENGYIYDVTPWPPGTGQGPYRYFHPSYTVGGTPYTHKR